MRKFTATLLISTLALSLGACKKDAEPAPAPVTEEQAAQEAANEAFPPLPVEPPADAVLPVTVAADAFKIGSTVGANSEAAMPKPAYAIGDTVYASLPARRYRKGSTANVYWTYQDGLSQKEETKEISGEFVTFAFSKADGMKPGKYNVEIGVDDKPVGIVDFVVQ